MKTKQQEREALEQIKQILKDFGPDTYLGMAFEGCIEDAEENIANDFGCSMKQRFDSAVQQIEKLDSKIKTLTDEAEAAKTALSRVQAHVLPPKVLNSVFSLVCNDQNSLKEKARKQAENIVLLADDPTQPNFIDAVNRHRNYLSAIQYDEEILEAIRAIIK